MNKEALKIFISFAQEDIALRDELVQALKEQLRRENYCSTLIFYDREINSSHDWKVEVDQRINEADAILFLIGPALQSSDYLSGIEVERAIERKKESETLVIPIILARSGWETAPLGKLQDLGYEISADQLKDRTDELTFIALEILFRLHSPFPVSKNLHDKFDLRHLKQFTTGSTRDIKIKVSDSVFSLFSAFSYNCAGSIVEEESKDKDGKGFSPCYIYAEMDDRVIVCRVTTLEVIVSGDQIEFQSGSTTQGGTINVSSDKRLI